MSQVKDNITALKSYIASMNCAISKAESGSDCEDSYFIEKLERMSNRLGYDIKKRKAKPRYILAGTMPVILLLVLLFVGSAIAGTKHDHEHNVFTAESTALWDRLEAMANAPDVDRGEAKPLQQMRSPEYMEKEKIKIQQGKIRLQAEQKYNSYKNAIDKSSYAEKNRHKEYFYAMVAVGLVAICGLVGIFKYKEKKTKEEEKIEQLEDKIKEMNKKDKDNKRIEQLEKENKELKSDYAEYRLRWADAEREGKEQGGKKKSQLYI